MNEPKNQVPVARPQWPAGKTEARAIRDFKDLIVWQRAMDAAVEVYQLVRKLPREETYALGDQLRRAVVSIPSNIAEGFGRNSKKDYAKFLVMARGSAYETETQLLLCVRVRHLSEKDIQQALSLLREVGRMLNAILSKACAAGASLRTGTWRLASGN